MALLNQLWSRKYYKRKRTARNQRNETKVNKNNYNNSSESVQPEQKITKVTSIQLSKGDKQYPCHRYYLSTGGPHCFAESQTDRNRHGKTIINTK